MSEKMIPSGDKITNLILATGRVVTRKDYPNGSCMLVVATKNGRDMFPRFFCAKGIVPELAQHARVRIEARVVSDKRKDRETSKWVVVQRFEAYKVEPDTTLTEDAFGVKGKFFSPPAIDIYLRGKVIGIKEDSEWIRFTVQLPAEGKRISTALISMKKIDRQPDIKKGNDIVAVCSVTTPKKERNGEVRYYEDIIVRDIAKA
jgi:hypothetical protein